MRDLLLRATPAAVARATMRKMIAFDV